MRDKFTILLEIYDNFEIIQDLMDKKGKNKLNELLALLYSVDYKSSKISILMNFVRERFNNPLVNSPILRTRIFNDLKNSELKAIKKEIRSLKKDLFKTLKLMEEIYSVVWKVCAKNNAKGCEAVVKVSMSIERWKDLIEEIEKFEDELKTI